MARVQIDLPEHFNFSTQVDVLIQHINIGRHLANEQLVALLNEARVRFMQSISIEKGLAGSRSFINADLAVIYKAEAKYADTLQIDVAATDFHRYGCDFVYRVTRVQDNQLIAIAKTAMLSFDYETGKLAEVDEDFPQRFV